jgi:hypothetical protein
MRGVKVQLHASLNSALDGVSGQLYVPAALPQGEIPYYPLDRRLDAVARRKKSHHYTCQESNPGRLVSILTELHIVSVTYITPRLLFLTFIRIHHSYLPQRTAFHATYRAQLKITNAA